MEIIALVVGIYGLGMWVLLSLGKSTKARERAYKGEK